MRYIILLAFLACLIGCQSTKVVIYAEKEWEDSKVRVMVEPW